MGNALSPPLLGDVRNGKFIKWPLSEPLPITHMCPTLCFTRRLTLAFSLVAQQSRISPQCMRCRLNPWVRKIPWRRVWQPTPLFLPGESHGQRSLVGYTVHRVAKSQTQLKWQLYLPWASGSGNFRQIPLVVEVGEGKQNCPCVPQRDPPHRPFLW